MLVNTPASLNVTGMARRRFDIVVEGYTSVLPAIPVPELSEGIESAMRITEVNGKRVMFELYFVPFTSTIGLLN